MRLHQATRDRETQSHSGLIRYTGIWNLEEVTKNFLVIFGGDSWASIGYRYPDRVRR